MKVIKEQVTSYIFQIANGIIPLAFLILMYAVFSFDAMSLYFMTLSISGLILMAVDFGFNMSPIRELQKLELNAIFNVFPKKFLAITYSKLTLSFFLLPCFIGFSYSAINPFSNSMLLSIYIISVLTSILNIQWFLFSVNKSIEFASILLIFRLLSVVFCVLLYFSFFDVTIEQASLFLLCVPLVANIVILAKYRKILRIPAKEKSIRISDVTSEIKSSSKIFLNTSIDVAVKTGWPITLFALSGSKELVSVYGLIERAVKSIYLLFSPLPFFLLSNSSILEGWKDFLSQLLEKKLVLYGLMAFLLGPFVIFVAILCYDLFEHSFFKGYRLPIIAVYLFQPYLLIANLLIYTYLVHKSRELLLTVAIVISVISLIFISLTEILPFVLYPFFFDMILIAFLIILIIKNDFKGKNA